QITPDLEGNIYKSQKRIDEENKAKKQQNNNKTSNKGSNNQTTESKPSATKPNTSDAQSSNNTSVPTYRRDIASQYVSRINAFRIENGLPELPVTEEAQKEADMRAKQIVSDFSHNSSYGFGENIGNGPKGYDFVEAWKNSWGHKNAMLREQNTAMAVSVYEVDNMWYAVTSFRMNY
ncbi:MAG: CAP domain-containing protein, partial [Bacilli bacterium]|nr:CAP domain-containing protein [Bacilli bacterium]